MLAFVGIEVRKCSSECDVVEALYHDRYSLKQITSFSVDPRLQRNELTQIADKTEDILIDGS